MPMQSVPFPPGLAIRLLAITAVVLRTMAERVSSRRQVWAEVLGLQGFPVLIPDVSLHRVDGVFEPEFARSEM